MSFELFGIKDVAIFDLWTLIHILSGISVGYLIILLLKNKGVNKNKSVIIGILSMLVIAYFWELTEYLSETGIFGSIIMNWFYSVEFLPNRLLVDPLTFLFGYFIVLKKPVTFYPALILNLIWLSLNIFIFPDVVYLQRLI
ncbi:hypothetical protein HY448_02800 [Candidatus Pacearchaeota archaeon]|nr:hypothetical protein [Candidatus Pacearchaeota archaeon]